MRKHLILLSGLLLVFASSALAEKCKTRKTNYGVSVTGVRYRKNVRHLLLAGKLKGDKKRVYEKHGFTFNRLRFDRAGKFTERWRYYKEGLEFVFDEDSNLIEKRTISKEDRRKGIR